MKNFSHKKTAGVLNLLTLAAIMLRIPLTHHWCIVNGKYFSYIAKAIYVCAAVCVAVVAYNLFAFRKELKLSKYEFLFGVLIGCLVLCRANALRPRLALYGEAGRNEGLFMLLCYYLFFYAARLVAEENHRRTLLNIFMAVMAVHALYGLGQFYDLTQLSFIHDYYHYAISGVAGNPNFMGSLMVTACGVCTGLLIYSDKIIAKAVYAALLVIFVPTLIFTRTMSAYLGLGVIVFSVAVIFLKYLYRHKGRKITALVLGGLAVGGVAALFIADRLAYGLIFKELNIIIGQLKGGIDIETVASGRFLIWSNIFKMLPEYLLLGVGIDGLQLPYFERYGLFFGAYLDKAHNELLHILITMGLPALILYILLYVFIIRDLSARIKTQKNNAVNMALLFAFIGYMTQAMFNISVIDVAPYFWIILGLAAKPVTRE